MRVTGKISTRTALIAVFVLSLVLRLAAVFGAKTYQIDEADNQWAFGYEVGRVAQSIAAGSGYASPMRVEKQCMAQAVQFIRENPGKFLELTRIRFVSWWIGEATSWQGHLHTGLPLALFKRTVYLLPVPFFLIGAIVARRNPAAQMVLLLVFTYPVPYYFVHINERYRFPIEPLLVLLAAEGLAVTLRWLKSWRSPTIPPTELIHQPS
jgi:hypothetical protein